MIPLIAASLHSELNLEANPSFCMPDAQHAPVPPGARDDGMIDSIVRLLTFPQCASPCLPAHLCVSLHARHLTSATLSPAARLHVWDVVTASPLVCRHRSGKERREGVHRRAAGAEEEKRPTGGGWRQVSRLDNFCYFPPSKVPKLCNPFWS